jgi:biotin transport system substrate-specific component
MKAITYAHRRQLIFEVSLISGFVVLMILSAYVRIPLFFTPVPITMQTFAVYLSMVFLRKKSVFSQGIYLLLGTVGLPVFSNFGSGIIYLLGPTGGYILGFFIAAIIFSRLLPKEKNFFRNFLFFVSVASFIYAFGIFWLIFLHQFTLSAALTAGLFPFVAGEFFKIGIASFIALRQRADVR